MNGVYSKVLTEPGADGLRAGVFLDRDGVIIEDPGYAARAEDVRWVPGAAESIAALNAAGMPVILITNQSGIGRGYYGWDDFERVQTAIEDGLRARGARIDAVWACAYHEDGIPEYRVAGHSHRKPNPGMLLDAAARMNIDLASSWMVGDKVSDVEAGLRAGTFVFHVATGYGAERRGEVLRLADGDCRIRVGTDVGEAVRVILAERVAG